MEINRHNYETYFLLWIDRELSVAEQEAVALFVAENPDLAEELALLQDAKLPQDGEELFFPDKASLLKQESAGISLNNYTEYFLLYVDGELSPAEQQQTELFVLQHPQLQPEFLLFQQARLPQEQVVFPDKSVLYRKEQKEKPVVFMMWRRIAVAAVLTGLAFSVWMLVPEDAVQRNSTPLAANAGVKASQSPATANKGSKTQEPLPLVQLPEAVVPQHLAKSNTIAVPVVEKGGSPAAVVSDNSQLMASSGEVTLPANQVSAATETTSAANLQTETGRIGVEDIEVKQFNNTQAQAADNDHADLIKPTVYKELDTDDNSKSLYVGTMEINRDKLRGFLRKAGTIFRSKSRQEDDKIDTNK